jgi:hypothetical protein
VTATGSNRGRPTRAPGAPSAVRGAALIGLAVIVGVVGLQILDDSDSGSSSAAGNSATTAAGAVTTTTIAVRPPAQVRVKVYNASGVLGVAQTATDTLKASGYNAQTPDTISTKRPGKVVQCRPGFDREANLLAVAVGTGATVEPFPGSPPAGADTADCLVIIGTT